MRLCVTCIAFASAALAACTGRGLRTRTGYADVNGARLYYEERGRGEPVVLLQGGQLPLQMWDGEFAWLSDRYRVVRYDARGFGRSSAKRAPYAYHDDLYALLRALNVPRATLVGLSLGGRVAVDFALQHPEMVDGLVLVGPGLSGFHFSDPPAAWMDSVVVAWRARDSVRLSQLWLDNDYMKPAMRNPTLAPTLRRLSAMNASLWVQVDSERPMSPPAIGRLGEIRARTLIILGALDTPDIHAITDSLLRAIPGARRVVIPDVGHMVNMEQPGRFRTALTSFLPLAEH